MRSNITACYVNDHAAACQVELRSSKKITETWEQIADRFGWDTVPDQTQRRRISGGLSGNNIDPGSTTVTGTVTHKKLQKLKTREL